MDICSYIRSHNESCLILKIFSLLLLPYLYFEFDIHEKERLIKLSRPALVQIHVTYNTSKQQISKHKAQPSGFCSRKSYFCKDDPGIPVRILSEIQHIQYFTSGELWNRSLNVPSYVVLAVAANIC